jgi:hypothetical protein
MNWYENIKQVRVNNDGHNNSIYLRYNDGDWEDYTQPLMEGIYEYIWEYEQDVLGRETTDDEWVECRTSWLEHFCISNEIKSLIVDGEEHFNNKGVNND